MVVCECGEELNITIVNSKMKRVSCSKCGLDYKRRFYDKQLFEIRAPMGNTNFNIKPLFSDIWRIFKRKNVNFAVRFASDSGYWFEWWTPTWHFGKGPYITIAFWRFRIYRGY
jgi:hypothetical protein